MTISRRNCVFVALSNSVGHELIFRHYTRKVVVGSYTHNNSEQNVKSTKGSEKKKEKA